MFGCHSSEVVAFILFNAAFCSPTDSLIYVVSVTLDDALCPAAFLTNEILPPVAKFKLTVKVFRAR